MGACCGSCRNPLICAIFFDSGFASTAQAWLCLEWSQRLYPSPMAMPV
jgi:hypothetical protein